MRITNNMIVNNTKMNINLNKTSVDKYNTQMANQKKISRPSDDAVIAIRSLRLSNSLSEVIQYHEKNIPDATSWLNVTQTALENMNTILNDVYKQCVNGSTDTLSEDDRNAILKNLQALREQVYQEGNADYAGRTVFTGYKTNQTLTFTEQNTEYDYNLTENFSYSDINERKYHANLVTVPTVPDQVNGTANDWIIPSEETAQGSMPLETVHDRIRLSYDGIRFDLDDTTQAAFDTAVKAAEDALNAANLPALETAVKDAAAAFKTAEEAYNATDEKKEVDAAQADVDVATVKKDEAQKAVEAAQAAIDALPDTATGDEITAANDALTAANDALTAANGALTAAETALTNAQTALAATTEATAYNDAETALTAAITNYDNVVNTYNSALDAAYKDAYGNVMTVSYVDENRVKHENIPIGSLPLDANGTNPSLRVMDSKEWEQEDYAIDSNSVYIITDTGEIVLGSAVSDFLKKGSADISVNYDKQGFDKGELRPEMYFDCTRKLTGENGDVETIVFEKEVQEIYYTISKNQTLAINTQPESVFDANIGRDIDELTEAVQAAINAHAKVKQIEELKTQSQYADEESQKNLQLWLDAAEKEAAYADDYMQELYGNGISKFQGYMTKVNLAITDAGSKSSRLELTKSRMCTQQSNLEELKSSNEDRDLSDIVIDYTAAYTAYTAALQAASKINASSLLDYL